ncbi:FG-GAP and VCBS repeat-containing protein [Streptomyces nigra]|uniref:FG-GAP and VCBS repeat-containing protein n=1 Tax=Streptomyces nigra TaxID=1827580 RepID=UPI0035E046FE
MTHRKPAAVAAASFLLLTGAVITAAPGAHAGTPGGTHAVDRNSDFDGDGYDDVLVGAPTGTDGSRKNSGYVTVQYGGPRGIGTASGTRKARTAIFGQNTPGVPGSAESGDGFGAAVASGDLDGDGYDDAIVAVPGEDVGGVKDAGRVTVLFGSRTGLTASGSVALGAATPAADAGFGLAVAAARLSGAVPGDVLAVADRQGVHLFTHDGGALRPAGRLDTVGAPGDEKIQPASLTTGDYDDDGFADLIVAGRSLEEDGQGRSAVYRGGAGGLTYVRDLPGGPATASGDIDHDGYDDLVAGRPDRLEDEYEPLTGGSVLVFLGGPDAFTDLDEYGRPDQVWLQRDPGVPGTPELGDGFGYDVSLGDADGDGFADLAIGVPGEDVGTVRDAGMVVVLRGSARGLTTAGAVSFTQNTANVPGTVETGDRFGAQVRFADTDRDGRAGLLATAPGENSADGSAWHLPGSAAGVVARGSWSYGPRSLAAPPTDAGFGTAVDE